jgi:hypothetical protein
MKNTALIEAIGMKYARTELTLHIKTFTTKYHGQIIGKFSKKIRYLDLDPIKN